MALDANQVQPGSPMRRQIISAQQLGNNVDATLSVAIAAAGAGTGEFHGAPIALARGRIRRIFAGNITTAIIGNSTHDLIPKRYPKRCLLAKGALTQIPLLVAPGLRLDVNNIAGQLEEIVALSEIEEVQVLQAPGGANQVKLAAADARPDGFWCDADIEILQGAGKGQKNRITSYANATKIGTVLNAEGSPNWRVATDATSVARVTTRRTVCEKDDIFSFVWDFTVGTGTAGVDAIAGIEIEFDDEANA